MNYPKRHHFIPVMLSRHFADREGRLYFFDKRYPDKGVRRSTPKNLFVHRYLYTQHDKDGNKDSTVETALGHLEGRVSPIISRIIRSARKQKTPDLMTTEKKDWSLYSYIQWGRVPDIRERIRADAVPKEWFSQMIRDLGNEKEAKRIMQDAWVRSVLDPGSKVLPVLMKKGLGIAVVAKPSEAGFVIGSNPVVKLSYPGRAHLSDPSVELWLPLAHDVAVTPIPEGREELVEVDQEVTSRINKDIFGQSRVIAGSSQEQIKSLSGEWKKS